MLPSSMKMELKNGALPCKDQGLRWSGMTGFSCPHATYIEGVGNSCSDKCESRVLPDGFVWADVFKTQVREL